MLACGALSEDGAGDRQADRDDGERSGLTRPRSLVTQSGNSWSRSQISTSWMMLATCTSRRSAYGRWPALRGMDVAPDAPSQSSSPCPDGKPGTSNLVRVPRLARTRLGDRFVRRRDRVPDTGVSQEVSASAPAWRVALCPRLLDLVSSRSRHHRYAYRHWARPRLWLPC